MADNAQLLHVEGMQKKTLPPLPPCLSCVASAGFLNHWVATWLPPLAGNLATLHETALSRSICKLVDSIFAGSVSGTTDQVKGATRAELLGVLLPSWFLALAVAPFTL